MGNRYTNLSFNSLNDLPHLQLPYKELDSLLGEQQSKLDLFDASANLVPKYIQQSEDDRLLAGQIMKYQQDVKSQLTDIAKTGDVNSYMQGLTQAQNQIKKLYSPGGAADVLQQRLAQKEARDKQIDEFYKTNPKLATYYKQTTPYNKVGYNAQTGEYQPINSFGNVKPHVDEEDINTWFNTNLDNVKDSLLQSGVSKSKLDAITSLTDFWQVEGVSKDKLVSVFTTLFPKEFQDSLYQEETANKYFSGDSTPVDTNVFTKDEKGEYKLNMNNPVGRRIEGYSTLGSRKKVIHDRVKDDNEIALEGYKSQLRKKENEEFNKQAIVPIMPANKVVPKDIQYYVQDGKLKKNTNTSADLTKLRGQDGSPFPLWETANNVLSFFDRLFTSNDEADFNDPMLNNVREHMAVNTPGFWNMDESTQMEMVAKEVDRQSKESLGGNFTANTSSKLKENYDKIFGAVKYDKDGTLQYDPGLLPNFKVTTREGEKVAGQKFLNEVKDGKYGDKAGISYKGTVDDWTSPLPYGTTIMGVGNTEVHVEPDVESTKRPEAWANGLWRAKQNTGIGHTSNFKYFGNDYTAIYKPDGTYQVKQDGTNTWETVVEQVDANGQTNFVKAKK
jgi:hypothetical protein